MPGLSFLAETQANIGGTYCVNCAIVVQAAALSVCQATENHAAALARRTRVARSPARSLALLGERGRDGGRERGREREGEAGRHKFPCSHAGGFFFSFAGCRRSTGENTFHNIP